MQGRGLLWSGGGRRLVHVGRGIFSQSLQLVAWGCCSGLSPGGVVHVAPELLCALKA